MFSWERAVNMLHTGMVKRVTYNDIVRGISSDINWVLEGNDICRNFGNDRDGIYTPREPRRGFKEYIHES